MGGTLNVENPYIAKARLRSLRKYRPISCNKIDESALIDEVSLDEEFFENDGGLSFDERRSAIKKMSRAEEIYRNFPHLDCGSCGAPNCHALAEDVVNGEAKETDCLIKLRETFNRS